LITIKQEAPEAKRQKSANKQIEEPRSSTQFDSLLRKQEQIREFMEYFGLPEDDARSIKPELLSKILEKTREDSQPKRSPSPIKDISGQHQGRERFRPLSKLR
jgi:hypothetical protein